MFLNKLIELCSSSGYVVPNPFKKLKKRNDQMKLYLWPQGQKVGLKFKM